VPQSTFGHSLKLAVNRPDPMNKPGLRTLITANYWVLSKAPKMPHMMC
jgi:hypothetical protein